MSSRPAELEPAAAGPAASAYIQGRLADNFWIITCPLVALLLLAAVWRYSGYSDLAVYSVLFAFVVTGHHLPGWFRAFGEPTVYRRYRARLWTSVVAIPALIILPTALGLGAVALTVGAAFDLWHVSMQQHGFGRIYSAKAGDTDRNGARLDLACVLTWYGTAVAWSDAWMASIAQVFSRAGIPIFALLTPPAWRAIRLALALASLVLAGIYVARAVRLWREKRISTPHKHLLHLIAFAVVVYSYQFASWYRANSVQNLFHALQYFFMVWIFGHLSIRRDAVAPAPFYRRLFDRRAGIVLFAAAIGLYGLGAMALSSSGYRLNGVNAERGAQIIGSIGLASLLLHFYVDSFIWKVRSREVRTALAIDRGGAAVPSAEPAWRGVSHAVAYFGLPLALISIVGARNRGAEFARNDEAALRHEAALFPRSAIAQYSLGRAVLARSDTEEARRRLETSVALAPSLEGPATMLADLDTRRGDADSEERHLRLAIAANPRNPVLRYGLGNRLAFARHLEEAEGEYAAALRLDPRLAPVEENLGVVYKWRGDLPGALPHFRRAHQLDPNLPAATFDLAGALATLGQTPAALEVLDGYRRRHPGDATGANLDRAIRADAARTASTHARP